MNLSSMPKDEWKQSEEYAELWNYFKSNKVMEYSPVTIFVYNYKGDPEGLDVFRSNFRELIVSDKNKKNAETAFNHLLKLTDHMELASIQKSYLSDRQEIEINDQQNKLNQIQVKLEDSQKIVKKLEDRAKMLEDKNQKMTGEFVTILGIFTSITFATFGGIQLLGNVFGRMNSSKSTVVGSELMLGAVFLLGTYLILIALLTGIAKLTGKKYHTSFPTNYLLMLGFLTIFVGGMLYANQAWWKIIMKHWMIWLIGLIIVITLTLVVGYLFDKYVKKDNDITIIIDDIPFQ